MRPRDWTVAELSLSYHHAKCHDFWPDCGCGQYVATTYYQGLALCSTCRLQVETLASSYVLN